MLSIVVSPDPLLREVCEPCKKGEKGLKRLAAQMTQAMYKNNGVGIAAPQVGVNKRLVVIDVSEEGNEPLVMVNPEIVKTWGEMETADEGCLSCPGISVPVTRPAFACCRFEDFDGELWEIEGDGLLGRCLQHECDHLDGITLFESCDADAKLKALADYEAARAAGAKPGDVSVED